MIGRNALNAMAPGIYAKRMKKDFIRKSAVCREYEILKKENNFDFIRLFAACCVMVYHSVFHLDLQFLWLTKEGGIWFNEGVEVFFIMSGMLIYYSYKRSVEKGRPLWHYYANRFLRVAPAIYAYTIFIVITLIVIGATKLNDLFTTEFVAWTASHIFLTPVYHPDLFSHIGIGVLNGSLWTIPVEFSFYIFVPLLFLLQKKTSLLKMLSIVFVVWFFGMLAIDFIPSSIMTKLYGVTFIPYLLFFGLGIFWSKYWSKSPQHGFFAIIALLIYASLTYTSINLYFEILDVIVGGFALSYIVLWFGHKGPLMFSRVTNTIGDLSFGVYIWHMVVVNLFLYFNVPGQLSWMNSNLILLIVFTLSFGFAIISWNLIEKPALKLKPYDSRKEINAKLESQDIEKEKMFTKEAPQ